MELAIVIAVVVVALVFDYTNGFHDAANAIATSVSTRALTPRVALAMAAVMNFVGAFLGQEVADTVGSGDLAAAGVARPGDRDGRPARRDRVEPRSRGTSGCPRRPPTPSSVASSGAAVASGTTVEWPTVVDQGRSSR